MREVDLDDNVQIARAEQSAELLFDADDDSEVVVYEPRNLQEANAAVRRLGSLFEELPGTITRVLEAASGSANLLSSDRLQGLSEVVQNADDTGASQVRILLNPTELLISHDGSPVRLQHVLGFATPWLSTKGDDATTIGRFGIGLMTLRALSATMEVHCSPYHVQIGEPTLSPIGRTTLPPAFREIGWTTLRIPLQNGSLSPEDLVEWLDRWDDSALLFLRHVSRVILLDPRGEKVRELTLVRGGEEEVVVSSPSVIEVVSRHFAEARDGRSWVVYRADVHSPAGLSRARKSTGPTTPVSVALPLSPCQTGKVYAGLPVVSANSVLFASAQLDPLTSRLDFADNEWNGALVPLVAEVWSQAARDLFNLNPKVAWLAMPIAKIEGGDTGSSIVKQIEEAIADRARQWLAPRISFCVPGEGLVSLPNLAVEAKSLECILTEEETAKIADLKATLPSGVRDCAGVWRTVLDDWRSAGADLPEPVTVERALILMKDENRPVDATIALTSVALKEDLGDRLLGLPCVITHEGQRLVPPARNSPEAVSVSDTSLARQLGVVTLLHSVHLNDNEAATTVLAWLEKSGALIDGSDDRAVVYRLAAAGRAGNHLEDTLTDEQLQALRDAFELMDPADRLEVGADVGCAISLEAYTYDGESPRTLSAHPTDAYLPRRIDREPDSFAIAAEKTPGPIWVSEKYAEILRSPDGRRGIGAQRFLRLLGAATAPRLQSHPLLHHRFAGQSLGLYRRVHNGSESRDQEMQRRGATYTLQDYDSPDLRAVAIDISRERRKSHRRRRATALLATVGRAWDRHLSDYAEVESANDFRRWQKKGQLRAYWLWDVGDIAWLDDESGTPRRPIELRTRTAGNVAVYGGDSPNYLHRELYQPNRQAVLRAFGVTGDPSRSQLVDRLRRLRDSSHEGADTIPTSALQRETAIVYKALARDLVMGVSRRSDLNSVQLRNEFQKEQGLLLTNLGWLPRRSVLAGPRIFRNYRAFAPQVEDAEPLWDALQLRRPSPDDCLRVIHRIARTGDRPDGEDEAILLETLRALASHYKNDITVRPYRLSRLALWTSKGWQRERPVYATDDRVLAKGLRDQLPLWEPGGDLEQFQPLLGPLRVEEIRAADTEVLDPSVAAIDDGATELFQKAVSLLEEDLARNDHQLFEGVNVPWDILRKFDVRIHPSLALRIRTGSEDSGNEYTSKTEAKVDVAFGSMFIKSLTVLPRVDGGGRALAALFEGNARSLAQAWRAACDLAEEGIEAGRLELARQRDERERASVEQEIQKRTTVFRELTAESENTTPGTKARASSIGGSRSKSKATDLGPPRVLVDPTSLTLVDPRGKIEEGKKGTRRRRGRIVKLVDPVPGSTPPRNRTSLRAYSDIEKEDVGMDLVRKLLSSDRDEIVDLRTQRGVGADAVDRMKRFYELKVSAGPEPNQVTLTKSEVQRAMTTDKFFLVVASGVEGINANPKVRVFVDPLNQLQQTHNGSITLSGIRNSESLIYEFENTHDLAGSSAADGEVQILADS